MADTLPCPDGAGSINNAEVPAQVSTTPPYTVVSPCVGDWDMSVVDTCSAEFDRIQESRAAEMLNINGAPLNIYRLLGVHEQGDGSIISQGTVFASTPSPGYPVSNILGAGAWRSFQTSTAVSGVAYVGVDFGINTKPTNEPEYLPYKPNLPKIGAISITQANAVNNMARQVRVETTDGKVEVGATVGLGTWVAVPGPHAEEGLVTITFSSATNFSATFRRLNLTASTSIGSGTVALGLKHPIVSLSVTGAFTAGDIVTIQLSYVWKRQGVFNLAQSSSPILLNLQREILAKAVRVVPTLYTGTGNWEISAMDVLDSPPTDINNIQDLFFNENRDRDYHKVPLRIKAQYSISNSITDLSKYGLNILDQYSFVISFAAMVELMGRPIVTGDIIEVIPEMQYDHNLKPIRKFLEVTDTGWASEGYTPTWKPTLYRFAAQQALPSQETRDIFGTIDTQKYLVADNFFQSIGVGEQIDTTPLTQSEEIRKSAEKVVPELGDDLTTSVASVKIPVPAPPVNAKGQPAIAPHNGTQGIYIEDGLPPNGQTYGEGYALPDSTTAADGDYFRLYYPESTKLPARLYRFSLIKNRWIYMETDRRSAASSLKPSLQNIMNSPTKQGLQKKTQ